ncbi:DUF4132 domain-containing protein [Streptomyces sp. NPDC093252]|uniref:DUF4132 domain-containing protein n=1 Tax=Streptomyces sp. NPDC093252 TaxID=3154980 RepID=UPI0034341A8F
MLYDSLVAASRTNDPLDGVRLAALDRSRWLVDLLERQRAAYHDTAGAGYRPDGGAGAAIRARINGRLAACGDEDGRAAVITLVLAAGWDDILWDHRDEIRPLAERIRGWTPDEVAVLLVRAGEHETLTLISDTLHHALDAADLLDADGRRALLPRLRQAHARAMETGAAREPAAPAHRLRELIADVDETVVADGLIPPGAPWAAALDIRARKEPSPEFAQLVRDLADPAGARPTQRRRRTSTALVDAAGARELLGEVLGALAEGDPVCVGGTCTATDPAAPGPAAPGPAGTDPASPGPGAPARHPHVLVEESGADLARGVVRAAAWTGGPAAVWHLGTLALRTGSGRGAPVSQDPALAGTAINALGDIGDPTALETLRHLRDRITHQGLRKRIDAALITAAGKQGLTAEQLIERGVPDHGLGPDGSRDWTLGGHRVRLLIEDAATVRLTFTAPGGATSRTAPAALRDGHPERLKELKDLAKEVRGTLSGERARIEAQLAAGREWPYDDWCRHYRDHPVTGTVVRALIREFRDPDGVWQPVAPLTEPGPDERRPVAVRLWHPVRATADDIAAWRERLVAERLRQPFKQAYREIYPLTPAELATGTYSNRFAAHIVHYPRLYALFKQRGWRANFLGRWDGGGEGLALRESADGRWRAGLHHEPAADDGHGHAPAHATTDQVRFERRDGRTWQPVPLAEVPPLVFSEAMRDVDLFVAVTSIAADPDWTDRGEDRHTAYRRAAGFGELTATAEVRREALARILPKLRIAGRCTLDGRFLTVRGDLRTYRVHLGSANILMDPDDTYLCIVPGTTRPPGTLFLPFEDERLSLILSKAFLLAADSAITDPTILNQLRPRP